MSKLKGLRICNKHENNPHNIDGEDFTYYGECLQCCIEELKIENTQLERERDEARREVCVYASTDTSGGLNTLLGTKIPGMREYAEKRNWQYLWKSWSEIEE